MRFALRELMASLADWLRDGDLAGHLRAWHEVVSGRVSLEEAA